MGAVWKHSEDAHEFVVQINAVQPEVLNHLHSGRDERGSVAGVGDAIPAGSATPDGERDLELTVGLLEKEQLLEVAVEVVSL